jgi:hypothetical protein
MEQLHYNLLYRWFVGLGADEPWRELALESAIAKLDKYHLLILDDIA